MGIRGFCVLRQEANSQKTFWKSCGGEGGAASAPFLCAEQTCSSCWKPAVCHSDTILGAMALGSGGLSLHFHVRAGAVPGTSGRHFLEMGWGSFVIAKLSNRQLCQEKAG
jgi:hypothetical protein